MDFRLRRLGQPRPRVADVDKQSEESGEYIFCACYVYDGMVGDWNFRVPCYQFSTANQFFS